MRQSDDKMLGGNRMTDEEIRLLCVDFNGNSLDIRAERTCKDVGVSGNWECSACGTSISDTYYFINGYINYCPNYAEQR